MSPYSRPAMGPNKPTDFKQETRHISKDISGQTSSFWDSAFGKSTLEGPLVVWVPWWRGVVVVVGDRNAVYLKGMVSPMTCDAMR